MRLAADKRLHPSEVSIAEPFLKTDEGIIINAFCWCIISTIRSSDSLEAPHVDLHVTRDYAGDLTACLEYCIGRLAHETAFFGRGVFHGLPEDIPCPCDLAIVWMNSRAGTTRHANSIQFIHCKQHKKTQQYRHRHTKNRHFKFIPTSR